MSKHAAILVPRPRLRAPRTQRWAVLGGALAFLWLATYASSAWASGPPLVGAEWSSAVGSDSAKLSAFINPNGSNTTYHFEYTTEANYQAHGFTGALRSPASGETTLGLSALTVTKSISSLATATAYRYRAVAQNADPAGSQFGSTRTFTTPAPAPGSAGDTCSNKPVRAQQFSTFLADCRAFEMISPVDKNGGQVDPPGGISDGGVLQGAADGNSVTYGSQASFAGGQGAPGASQYVATRTGGSWSTENVTPPISYHSGDGGVPYQLFSADLARGLLLNGSHCAGGVNGCAVENPPIPGSDAPAGYEDYYMRNGPGGSFEALLGTADITDLDLGPHDFDLSFAGASPDLGHVVISSCAALVPGATEVPQGSGCDPSKQNLYEWASGSGLTLLNGATSGAALAAQAGAVSTGGDRVFWRDTASGDLYLHDGTGNHLVASGPASFQTASADAATAFYTQAGDLYSYDAASHTSSAALASGVVGVLGASAGGDTVYFQNAAGLQRRHSGTTTLVAPNQASPPADAAGSSDYPPTTGTARVSADGTKLVFLSSVSLTGYDNTDLITGSPDPEVYLYDSAGPTLACASCNPTNERPIGPSTIPGSIPNGSAPGSTDSYKPRVLSSDGKRVFFDSQDALALTDTNSNHLTGGGIPDVYEWEAQGEGSCAAAGGCATLVSSGRSAGGALFVDSSADGSDAFFITDDSLLGADPGSLDLYDARIDGGVLVPSPPIPCEGDACQVLPPVPNDPTLTTLLSGHGNPPVHYYNLNHFKNHHKKKHHPKRKHHKRRGSGR